MVQAVSSGVVSSPICVLVEATCTYRLPRAGTIQNMRLHIEFNEYNGPTVVTLFVNGIPTSLSTTVPAASTEDIDVPNTVAVLDGDKVTIMMDASTVSSGWIIFNVSYEIR